MTVLLFVHGTGAREAGHDLTLRTIKRHVSTLGRDWSVETCYWGSPLGAALGLGGASVPDYRTPDDARTPPQPNDDVALWSVLYSDPFYELRILGLKPAGPQPFGLSASEHLLRTMRSFAPSEATRAFFDDLDLGTALADAVRAVSSSAELAEAALTAEADPVEHRQAIARAIVARSLAEAQAASIPSVSGWMRDKLVAHVASDLKADVLGAPTWLKKASGQLVARIATPALVAQRGALTDAAIPAIGDILRFLARPELFAEYLAARIRHLTDPDVYLLGHSLGGIICLETLARAVPPNVRGLITVGSQAPLFHEIGALPALDAGESLPADMPPWLNIWDPRDLLSYTAADVFGATATDVEVDSGQPFPFSHSAYFTTPEVWAEIERFAVTPWAGT